ncbi:hypothetical protein [Teredinibacter sp. KSP-S5-2]|uniref:hypothetical protein n=1 Tax=Teredinibacter sp. KSP-S5-2 TaxID=3034506 RepID=UPI002934A045|nr:hypothetical protein [Teredinibacter sp. KSP-S5-2]WNO10616.1 hypothetical protein P5V12_05455 [Teredinibacter sp. KSP-S5-2]
MNIEEAKEIMRVIDGNIKSQNYEYDYLAVVKSISIEDGEYWYYLSQVLRDLPESNEMDLRDNGALAAAIYASEKSYGFSPNSAGTIAEKILALTMPNSRFECKSKYGV